MMARTMAPDRVHRRIARKGSSGSVPGSVLREWLWADRKRCEITEREAG